MATLCLHNYPCNYGLFLVQGVSCIFSFSFQVWILAPKLLKFHFKPLGRWSGCFQLNKRLQIIDHLMMEWLLTTGQPVPAQGGCYLKFKLQVVLVLMILIFSVIYISACMWTQLFLVCWTFKILWFHSRCVFLSSKVSKTESVQGFKVQPGLFRCIPINIWQYIINIMYVKYTSRNNWNIPVALVHWFLSFCF